jgi:hypothetical protein
MESCVMNEPTKLLISMWGFSLSAEGLVAILAAVVIIALLVFGTRRRL